MTFALPTAATTYVSLPLTRESVYTGIVSAVTPNTIAVADSPAPFTQDYATAAAPYFVKFLSGNEAGRVLLINANSTSELTLDTTDNATGAAVALTATGFSVAAGDTFEIFPGDTLASIFGGAGQAPVLTGGESPFASDEVSVYGVANSAPATYYFNTSLGYWVAIGTAANANNTIIYPYSALAVTLRAGHPSTNLVLAGRVTPVGAAAKMVGMAQVYSSTHYAADVKLSQLKFGANWQRGAYAFQSDTLGVWNPTTGAFDFYFQKPDLTWGKQGPNPFADQSNFTIPAGTVTIITKRAAVAGANAFLVSALPYTL